MGVIHLSLPSYSPHMPATDRRTFILTIVTRSRIQYDEILTGKHLHFVRVWHYEVKKKYSRHNKNTAKFFYTQYYVCRITLASKGLRYFYKVKKFYAHLFPSGRIFPFGKDSY